MSQGILLVDKPPGKTSFFLVILLRKLLRVKKIGHAGTLDPLATGVMVMLIGRDYTRLSPTLTGHDKAYHATVQLGRTTDSYDSDGIDVSTSPLVPTLEEIQTALHQFQGTTLQTPPMFSAKKVGGQKLCDLARAGKTIERAAVSVTMKVEILEYNYPFLKLSVSCTKGTYIRSLAHDLGHVLGCGGCITGLIRTKSGEFELDQCLSIDTITSDNFDFSPHLRAYTTC